MVIKLMRSMLAGSIQEYIPKKRIYEDTELWNFYLSMAKPYNVTKKVLDTLLGLLLGGGVTAESKVISDTGLMYRDFIENVAKEILSVGYVGVYLDVSNKFVMYTAENILSFKMNQAGEVTRVVLRESYDANPNADYEQIMTRNRILRLIDGSARVQVDKESETKIMVKGKQLSYLPFLVISF